MLEHQSCHKNFSKKNIGFIVLGISSLIWLILRSGKKPSRLAYPCQRLAAANSLALLAWLSSLIAAHLVFKNRQDLLKRSTILLIMIFLLVAGLKSYKVIETARRPKTIWGQTERSKVVWVRNTNAAKGWNANPDYENKADQTVIQNMMNEGIKALTNQATVRDSWIFIFQNHNSDGHDYRAGEKIAIKINNNDISNLSLHNPLIQTIRALLTQLIVEKGVPQQDIIVYDTSRTFDSYQINGIRNFFPDVVLNPPGYSTQGVLNVVFSQVVEDATYIINMPLLRAHAMAGATLSFKNHFGSINCPGCLHNGFFDTSSTNSLVQVNSHPFIKDKTILVIDDAIYGLTVGPNSNPDDPYAGIQPYPNSLFFSTDPVAIDSVMVDYLQDVDARLTESGDPRIYLQVAASAGLGNYATSCSGSNCIFNYANIDLIQCDQNCVLASTPTPLATATSTPLPTPTPTPPSDHCQPLGNIDCLGTVNVLDLSMLISKFGSNDIDSDLDDSGKVNVIDLSILLSNFGK